MIKAKFRDRRNVLRDAEIIVKDDTQVAGRSDRLKNNTVRLMNRGVIDVFELSRKTNKKKLGF